MTTTSVYCKVLKDVLVDAKVEASFDNMWSVQRAKRSADREALAEALEKCVAQFEEFLRDHRSQDIVHLEVVRVRQTICSACRAEWEPDKEEHGVYCACCGACVEEPT